MGQRAERVSLPGKASSAEGVGEPPKADPLGNHKLDKELGRLKRANSRLRKMEKFRVDLTHMIIHDLKGPLAEVIANLSLLQEEQLSAIQRDYISSAMLGAEEILRRVQNILEIYRLETKRKFIRHRLFKPLEVIQEVVTGFSTLAAMKEISIQIHSTDGSRPLFADRDLFARVVLNLLINAIEHTPSGGKVEVELFWSEGGKRAQVAVTDSGPGIKRSDQKRIFRKFFTARQGTSVGHSGLGLSFCKLAVEAHGGKIGIEGLDGCGSRFFFSIPNSPCEYSRSRR